MTESVQKTNKILYCDCYCGNGSYTAGDQAKSDLFCGCKYFGCSQRRIRCIFEKSEKFCRCTVYNPCYHSDIFYSR